MKEIVKKVLLMFLAIMPIASVSFAAQSALNVAQAQSGNGSEDTTPSVSWTNGK